MTLIDGMKNAGYAALPIPRNPALVRVIDPRFV
jgi:hypothetical protein